MSEALRQKWAGLVGVWSLRSHLEVALATCWRRAIARHPLPDLPELQNQIGLRRVDAPTGVVYSSAIALRLAASLGIPSTDLVEALAQSWPPFIKDKADWADSLLRVTPKHLVQIHLGDRLLATWLQQFSRSTYSKFPDLSPGLSISRAPYSSDSRPPARVSLGRLQDNSFQGNYFQDNSFQDNSFQDNSFQDNYFELQAAHARCCSLLALAERVGLVRFEAQGAVDSELVWPMPLPWLKADGTLRIQQPVEQQLIGKLVDIVDVLVDASGQVQHRSAIALAQALSRCVYEFDAGCRVLGDVAGNQSELAQARLGLVRAAQQLLCWLLEGQLQVAAPASL
ncbi:MAG: hypothetical protein SNJ57_07525 [Cyanobacteriota bacterium]